MEEKSVIVIYEKEIKLNQILKEQLSIQDIYQIHEATDEKNLIELIETLTINLLILNLLLLQVIAWLVSKAKGLRRLYHLSFLK